ncbi:MAG: papain-like cysteine protease family protein, partial [Oscillospiraceae bacterium]
MKKLIVFTLAGLMIFTGCTKKPTQAAKTGGNYTDEMKIPYTCDLSKEDGADSAERLGDHKDSAYFNTLDFYNMKPTDTLSILQNFKTQQQTSEWSCGVSSALMVLNWYGKLGDYNEETLGAFRSNGLEAQATSLKQEIEMFKGVGGFSLYSTFDCQKNVSEVFTLDFIKETIKAGAPIIVGWNDWGGHWQVI